ncbi:alkene reductase [Mesorhizobium sp. CO1-1-8]|uniref:alkene reductase n=1 Tax=Mesorhizobium sp. CO1-1-8 TaxID=2876631 RepID=UPI001CD178F3|nr:alkene reductase [Mesorhizobium sp. CO1-1-8]MBZ9772448.1 alkene reductase [Mesorhizobium sp. CO1-1-8]
MSELFKPVEVGPIALAHRVVMAPLTRMRSEQPSDTPGDLMVECYTQRASEGGLIIAEATPVALTGRGYLGAPGIYREEHVAGWKKVTDAVHAKGSKIFLQLWHVGRTAHLELTGGATPVSASVTPYEGVACTTEGWVPVSPNRALDIDEIPGVIEQWRESAKRAKAAGFDGVEIHAGNGYLLDQFLADGSNKRIDRYGGSPENRARLLLEILHAVATVWGYDRVGARITPAGKWNGMSDGNPGATFGYVAQALAPFGLAYLHIVEPRIVGNQEETDGLPAVAAADLRKFFKGTIIAAGGFNGKSAEEIIARGDADLVAFGRHFVANPDLPKRLRLGLPLNPYDRDTFYGGTEKGYTDYPFYEETQLQAQA